MRSVRVVAACVGLAMSTAGHAADQALQRSLLDVYVGAICRQTSPNATCDGNWSSFVQAGMNDLDQRCDSFLVWLDYTRRSNTAIAAEILSIDNVQAITRVSGTGPQSLELAAVAFGVPSASGAASNSQLLMSADQATIQRIVHTSRAQFRIKISADAVPDRPAAIGLLRNYLQLCMPSTIEASMKAGGAN